MDNIISDLNAYCTCKSYNGEPTAEGMVLVPVWITDEILNSDCRIIHNNLITWEFCGCHFRIGFAPIKKESFADYMNKFFWPEMNEEIAKKRPDHCVINSKPDALVLEEAAKEELLEHLKSIDERFVKIVELRLKGYDLKEIFETLGLNQSQGCNVFKRAETEARKLWNL